MCVSGQGLSKRSQHGLSEPQIGDESSREKSRGLRKELVHGPKAAHGRSSLQPVTAWRKCSVTPPPTASRFRARRQAVPRNHAALAQLLAERVTGSFRNPLWSSHPGTDCTAPSKYYLRPPGFPAPGTPAQSSSQLAEGLPRAP